MARVVAEHGAALVIMHIRGTPEEMQKSVTYRDLFAEVTDYRAP
jgi:dihydropteroate synthase